MMAAETSSIATLDEGYEKLYQKLRDEGKEDILTLIERAMIERALGETDGNQVKTSAILGNHPSHPAQAHRTIPGRGLRVDHPDAYAFSSVVTRKA